MGCITSKSVRTIPKIQHNRIADFKGEKSNHVEPHSHAGASSTAGHNSIKDDVSPQKSSVDIPNRPLAQESKSPAEDNHQDQKENEKISSLKESAQLKEEKPSQEEIREQRAPKVNRFKSEENQLINIHKNKDANDFLQPKDVKSPQAEGILELEIYPNFKKIGVEQYDELLSQASKILKGAEQMRKGIEVAKEKAMTLSNVILLKEGSIKEVIQVLFWTISANNEGKIKQSGVEVYSDSPFIKLNKLKMKIDDAQELYDAFTEYLNAVNKGSGNVEEAEKSLAELNKQVLEIKEKTEDEINKSNMKDEQKIKAIKRQERYNDVYLPKELAKVMRLVPVIEKEVEEMKAIAGRLQQMFDGADEIGGKVHEEYIKMKGEGEDTEMDDDIEYMLAPAQIFNKYCLEVKKDLKEMDEYNRRLKEKQERAKAEKINRQREDQD